MHVWKHNDSLTNGRFFLFLNYPQPTKPKNNRHLYAVYGNTKWAQFLNPKP